LKYFLEILFFLLGKSKHQIRKEKKILERIYWKC